MHMPVGKITFYHSSLVFVISMEYVLRYQIAKLILVTLHLYIYIYIYVYINMCVHFVSSGIDFKIKTVELRGKKIKLQIW
jgi:hypothetical protein